MGISATLLASFFALTCSPEIANAQSFRDATDYCTRQISTDERRQKFRDSSWVEFSSDRTKASIVIGSLFLTTVDATNPESWSETYYRATDVAHAGVEATRYAFALSHQVALQKGPSGSEDCLVVFGDEYLDTFKNEYFPEAKIIQNGQRRFLAYEQGATAVTAAEWQTKLFSKARRYSKGYVFAAFFRTHFRKH